MSLLSNVLSRLVIAFLPRSKHLLISWPQSPFTVILKPKKIKFVIVSCFSPSICQEVIGLDAMIFIFWILSFKPAFHSPLSPSLRGSLVPLHFLPLECYLCIWGISVYLRNPGNLDSNLWFIQPGISHDILCVEVKQGDNIQSCCTPFPILNQSVVPFKVLTVDSWLGYRLLRRQVRWSDIADSLRIFHRRIPWWSSG